MVNYFLIVPPGDGATTPFQGYNVEVVEEDFLYLLEVLGGVPSSVYEIYMDQEQLLESRKGAVGRSINIVGCGYIDKEMINSCDGAVVIICLPAQIDKALELSGEAGDRSIVLSLESREGVLDISGGVSFNFLDKHLKKVIKYAEGSNRNSLQIEELRAPYDKEIPESYVNHAVASPNQFCLLSLGFKFEDNKEFVFNDLSNYIDLIKSSAESVSKYVWGEEGKGGSEMIIYSPAMYSHLYDFNQVFWNELFRKIKNKWLRDLIKNGVFKNREYSGIKMATEEGDFQNPYEDGVAGPLLKIRQKELYITTVAISLLSANKLAPSIRLPNAINLYGGILRDIEALSKRDGQKARVKIQKKFSTLNNNMMRDIGGELQFLIRDGSVACQVCSDVPLEWLRFGKIPLMFSHDVSRIPMTPGNMFLFYASLGRKAYINASDAQNVLVIRSFKQEDKIKDVLEKGVRAYLKDDAKTKVRFVDVDNVQQVIEELNKYSGYILVFDCHGDHGGATENGWLKIGNERLNTWELAHMARVPPIVMLSACLTSPISGSHASVANGLLRSGAMSVIGTFLPIDAVKSAVFIARILYRLEAYLPAIKSLGFSAVSWRAFVSGFMRMSYITDVVNFLQYDKQLLNEKQAEKIKIDANNVINLGEAGWFEQVSEIIERCLSVEEGWLSKKVFEEIPLTETMHYCQLGRPEDIVVHLEN